MIQRSKYIFTVVGKCEFPVDMLWYDSCYPTSSESAGQMLDAICRNNRPTEGWQGHVIQRFSAN